MAIYRNKYTLEFDDVIEGEFNDYKLEILKKYKIDSLNTANNVYITSYNANQGLIYQGTPVYIEGTIIKRSFGSGASTMPAIGVAYEDIPQGSNGIILTKGMMAYATAYGDQDVWVGSTGGLVLTEPSSGIVQKIGYKSGTGTGSFLVLFDQEVTLTGTNSPVVLNYNLTKDNIFAPIRSSYIDINLYHTDGLSDEQFWDLYITQDNGFRVVLYKNTIKFWEGWLGSSLVAEEQISSPYRVKLRAYDGLHLLKKIPYFDTTDIFQATANQFNDRYGYTKIKNIIGKCLFNTGLVAIDNQIISVLKLKNDDSTGSLSDDYFLDDTKMHHTSFMKGESDGMTCFKVLEMVLDSLGATIYQRDANWCIVRISDLTQFSKDAPPTCRRDLVWANSANPTSINKTTTSTGFNQASTRYTDDTPFFQIDGASTMTFQYPLKSVTIKQDNDHNFITSNQLDSVNDLGSSEPTGTLLYDEWVPEFGNNGAGIQEAVVLRDNKYSNGNANTPSNIDRNLGKALIEADAGTDSVTWANKQPCLKYPVTHKTIKKQIDFKEFAFNDAAGNPQYNYYSSGHVFSLKYRPLKGNPSSLATDNYIRVPFTLRLIATNTDVPYNTTTANVSALSENNAFFTSGYNDDSSVIRIAPFVQETRKPNEWQNVKLHVSENVVLTPFDTAGLAGVTESCELEARVYGGFLWVDGTSNQNDTFTDRYDVTYTDIKASPTVTKWIIEPVKQEYIVEQSSTYSRVESYDVKLGSNICTTGKNCFIGFEHGTNNALLSFDNWGIVFRGGNTIQHIVALGHMILYRIPIRRIDGTHYGNYKYGNKMTYDGGVNGSSGKFFPMGVQMDLRNARTTFSGDDLMNNFGYNLLNISRKIKWMGENDVSEIVDY